MTEFMGLNEPANASGLRKIMIDIERLAVNWERLSNKPVDEEAEAGKLRELIPSSILVLHCAEREECQDVP